MHKESYCCKMWEAAEFTHSCFVLWVDCDSGVFRQVIVRWILSSVLLLGTGQAKNMSRGDEPSGIGMLQGISVMFALLHSG